MLKDTRVTQERPIILPSKQKPRSNVWTIEKEKKILTRVIFCAKEKFQYSKFMLREFPELLAKQTSA